MNLEEIKRWYGLHEAPDGTLAAANLHRWSSNSLITDGKGSPVLYHGTTADFSQFEVSGIGIHVGTARAANDRLHLLGVHSEGVVMPVLARCQRVLDLPDIGWEFPASILDQLINSKVVSDQEADRLFAQVDRLTAEDEWHPEAFDLVRQAIFAAGYDGISYENECEDPGALSYIVLRPSDIKSAIGNCGAFSSADLDITDRKAAREALSARKAAQFVRESLRATLAPAI